VSTPHRRFANRWRLVRHRRSVAIGRRRDQFDARGAQRLDVVEFLLARYGKDAVDAVVLEGLELVLGMEEYARCAEANLTHLIDAGAICLRSLSLSPTFAAP
jgi:hypothetical protein